MTSPTTVEVLKKARALLEKGWCQGHYAIGESGREVDAMSKSARCFCIDGALIRANGTDSEYIATAAIVRAALGKAAFSPIGWNDAPGRTQSEVLDLMDRAIALASEKEAGHVG